jgi:hypothetical protein
MYRTVDKGLGIEAHRSQRGAKLVADIGDELRPDSAQMSDFRSVGQSQQDASVPDPPCAGANKALRPQRETQVGVGRFGSGAGRIAESDQRSLVGDLQQTTPHQRLRRSDDPVGEKPRGGLAHRLDSVSVSNEQHGVECGLRKRSKPGRD